MTGNARVYRHFHVPSSSFVKQGNQDPDFSFEGLFSTADFDDTAMQELYYTLNVPYRWSVGTDVIAHIFWLHDANAADAAKFVRWGIEYRCCAAGEAVAGGDGNNTVDQASLNANQGLLISTNFGTAIPAADMAAHDQVGVRFYRDATNDDYVGDARLVAIHFEFVKDKLGQPL